MHSGALYIITYIAYVAHQLRKRSFLVALGILCANTKQLLK